MSIQFRSRIEGQQSTPVVIGNNDSGWCCSLSQTSTRAECVSLIDGYFIPGASNGDNCPVINEGCGVKRGFGLGITGGCCYWSINSGNYEQNCKTVSSEYDCASLATNYPYSFYPGETCQFDGGTIKCNGVLQDYKPNYFICNPDSTEMCFNPDNVLGNCCYEINSEKNCAITTKKECYFGFWSPPKNQIQSCEEKKPCDGVYFPNKNGTPPTALLTTLQNSTNLIEKLPAIGEPYQGGIYLGIFTPGSPRNSKGSVLLGNQYSGGAGKYYARGDGPGLPGTSWILIGDMADFIESPYYTINESGQNKTYNNFDIFLNQTEASDFLINSINNETYENKLLQEIQTSSFDGFYNLPILGTELSKNIANHRTNGFSDWYLPSQDELAFMFNALPYNYIIDKQFNPLNKKYYMSSSVFSYTDKNGELKQVINNEKLIFAQSADSLETYGNVTLISAKKPASIRLVRRIYLTTTTKKSNFDIEDFINVSSLKQNTLIPKLKPNKFK